MYNISQIISLPVISIYESCNVGVVTEVLFDNNTKKAVTLCMVDENEFQIKKSLSVKSIYKIGKDAVIVKNCDGINLLDCEKISKQNLYFPNNFTVFDTDGLKIGNITDIILDNNYKISNIVINNNDNINADKILTFKKGILIIKKNNVKLSSFKSRVNIVKNINNDYIVKALADNQDLATTSLNVETQIGTTMQSNEVVQTPQKAITNYNFLIGRKILKNIVNINGEILAHKDSIVTYKTLDNMRKYGKLYELMSYSK